MKKENEKPKLTGIQKLMAKKEEGITINYLILIIFKNLGTKDGQNQEEAPPPPPPRPIPSPLFALKSFIEALTNKCEDGRIIVEKSESETK